MAAEWDHVRLAHYSVKRSNRRRKNRHSIRDGSPKHSGMLSHRINIAMFTQACWEHRRSVADVSATFLPSWISPNCLRLLYAVLSFSAVHRRWFLATNHREKFSMHALIFFSISWMPWWSMAITRVRHWSFARLYWRMVTTSWRCPDLRIAKASGGLKSPVGPWHYILATTGMYKRCWPCAGLMLGRRLLRWPSIKPSSD